MVGFDENFLKELQVEFINETELSLEEFDEALLCLETSENSKVELDTIFRVLHTIKGNAHIIGFTQLGEFSHHAEDFLSILRVQPETLNQECISVLLKVSDTIKLWLPYLSDKNGQVPNTVALEETLKNLTAQRESGAKPSESLDQTESQESSAAAELIVPTPVAPEKKAHINNIVKVDSERIDSLLNVVGELVVLKGLLMNETLQQEKNERLLSLSLLLDKTVRDLQNKTLSIRMTSLKPLFLKLQKTVRDVSLTLGKEVLFVMQGEDTEIDKVVIDSLTDPLMHIVRNAVDHGLESTENRLIAGKNSKGMIKVIAERRGGRMVIEVVDDGGGISRDKIKNKAIERGLLSTATDVSSWPDKKIFDFLMQPGFSTAEKITAISGRGVGLDVVRSHVEEIKGKLEIESILGKGSSFRLSIPFTTAIMDSMLVQVLNTTFAIPIDSVQEFVQLQEMTITQTSSRTKTVNVRGEIVPLLHLHTLLEGQETHVNDENIKNDRSVIVLVHGQNRTVALHVDHVIGQSQIVVKGLSPVFEEVAGVGGAAMLKDGTVGLILDIDGINQYFDNLDYN